MGKVHAKKAGPDPTEGKVLKQKTAGWSPLPTYVDWEDVFAACEEIRRKNAHGFGYDEVVKVPDPQPGDQDATKEEHHLWLSSPFTIKGKALGTGAGTLVPYWKKYGKGWSLVGHHETVLRSNCVSSTFNALAMALADGRKDGSGAYLPLLREDALDHDAYVNWYSADPKVPNEAGVHVLVSHNLGVWVKPGNLLRGDVLQIDWTTGGSHAVYCWDAHDDGEDVWIQVISSQTSTHGVGVIVPRDVLAVLGKPEQVEIRGVKATTHVFHADRTKPWLGTPEARDFYRTNGQWLRSKAKKGESGLGIKELYVGRFHRLFPRYPIALLGTNRVSSATKAYGKAHDAPDEAAPLALTAAATTAQYHANNEGSASVDAARPGGFFPIGVSRNWHGGIHLYPETEDAVYAPTDGVLVAARLSTGENKGALGDPGFVLVRTKLKIQGAGDVTFFTLLAHLRGLDRAAAHDVPWLDDFHAIPPAGDPRWTQNLDPKKTYRQILPVPAKPHRPRGEADAEDGALVAFEKRDRQSDKKGSFATGTIVAVLDHQDNHGWAKLKSVDGAVEGLCFAEERLGMIDTHGLDPKLKDKRDALFRGEVVELADLDRKIVVRSGEIVGRAGEISGTRAVHFEIFSEKLIPLLDKQKADIEDTTDDGFTDRSKFEQRFFESFDKTDEGGNGNGPSLQHVMLKSATRREDDMILQGEVKEFFQKSPLAARLRTLVTRHLSEWGDAIDWKKLDSAPEWKHYSAAAKQALHGEIDLLIWWKKGTLTKTELPDDQICYHYHPITFLAWLDKLREEDADGSLHASVFELNHEMRGGSS